MRWRGGFTAKIKSYHDFVKLFVERFGNKGIKVMQLRHLHDIKIDSSELRQW